MQGSGGGGVRASSHFNGRTGSKIEQFTNSWNEYVLRFWREYLRMRYDGPGVAFERPACCESVLLPERRPWGRLSFGRCYRA